MKSSIPLLCLFLGLVPMLHADTEESLQRRFPAQPGGKVTVQVDFGAIEVVAHPAAEVTVDVYRRVKMGSEKKEKDFLGARPVTFSQEGKEIGIRSIGQGSSGISWGGWSQRREARYRIGVPESTHLILDTAGGHIHVTGVSGDVRAKTSGGSLRFTSVNGSIQGKTAGGGIVVTDCQGGLVLGTSGGSIEVTGGGGSLKAETAGGSIRVGPFGGPAEARTSGGGITMDRVGGELRASTSGGSIKAVVPSPIPGPVRLETSGGSVTVTVGSDATFDLDASTSGGGVDSELPVTITGKASRSRLVGPVNGGGPEMRLRTSGGSIRVKKGVSTPVN